jgi:hypothetical protein
MPMALDVRNESEEVLRVMLTHLDNDEDTVLRNYTIPRGLQTHYDDEIMENTADGT